MLRSPLRATVTLITLLALALMLAPAAAPVQAQPAGRAWVRVVNAAPDSQGMAAFVDNIPAARGILPGSAFGFQVPAGKRQISFRRGVQIINNAVADLELESGDAVTVVAVNMVANLQALVLRDDNSAVTRGEVRIRAINAIVGSQGIDVVLVGGMLAEDRTIGSSLAFGAAGEYALVTNNERTNNPYTLQITAAGDPGTVLATLSSVTLRRERRYDVFALGTSDGQVQIFLAEAATLQATGTNQVRFGHFVPGVGPVDVVLNTEDAFNNVAFGNTTFALVLAPGVYRVELFPARKRDAPLLTEEITIEKDQSVFLAAAGTADVVDLKAYTDDYAPLRIGRARVQFVHVAAGNPDVSLQATDGTVLLAPVPYGGSGIVDVGAGTLPLRVVTSEGSRLFENALTFDNSTGTTLVLYDADPEAPGAQVASYNYGVSPVVPIRFVHASSQVQAVDVYLDGELAISNWSFGATTSYVDLLPGIREVKILAAGADPTSDVQPIINRRIDPGALPRTAVLLDQAGGPAITLYPDNLRQAGLGMARVRLIQASQDVGTVRWFNAADQTPIVSDPIGVGEASVSVNLAAGSYTFLIRSVTDPNIGLRVGPLQINAGSYLTLVVTGPSVDEVLTLETPIGPGN